MTTSPLIDGPEASGARHLPLAGTQNVRDVGGLPTVGGVRTRWRTLLRGDALHKLDDEGRRVLAGIGVRTVIDLREALEVETAPDALDGLDVRVINRPIFTADWDRKPSSLASVYQMMVDSCGENLTTVVRLLAEPGALPALVHCTAGKDRTGVVMALALSVAGVSDDVIAEDYALTAEYFDIRRLDNVRNMTVAIHTDAQLSDLGSSPPELILATLERIRSRHGSIEDFLLTHGATRDELAALRTALTELGPSAPDES